MSRWWGPTPAWAYCAVAILLMMQPLTQALIHALAPIGLSSALVSSGFGFIDGIAAGIVFERMSGPSLLGLTQKCHREMAEILSEMQATQRMMERLDGRGEEWKQ